MQQEPKGKTRYRSNRKEKRFDQNWNIFSENNDTESTQQIIEMIVGKTNLAWVKRMKSKKQLTDAKPSSTESFKIETNEANSAEWNVVKWTVEWRWKV